MTLSKEIATVLSKTRPDLAEMVKGGFLDQGVVLVTAAGQFSPNVIDKIVNLAKNYGGKLTRKKPGALMFDMVRRSAKEFIHKVREMGIARDVKFMNVPGTTGVDVYVMADVNERFEAIAGKDKPGKPLQPTDRKKIEQLAKKLKIDVAYRGIEKDDLGTPMSTWDAGYHDSKRFAEAIKKLGYGVEWNEGDVYAWINASVAVATTLRFISDPGHGWLEVPIAELDALGIRKDITRYSYMKGKMAYLEEDKDATTYLNALKKAGKPTPQIKEVYQERTPIRNYRSFATAQASDAEIKKWIAEADKHIQKITKQSDPDKAFMQQHLGFTKGPKLYRVYIESMDKAAKDRSAYCFIDLEGNIYKAASWSKPAKGIRGTVQTVDPNSIDQYTSWLYRR
jgi:hypothetical protein